MREIRAKGVCKGQASGPALVSQEPISFLGDLDITTGRIVGEVPSVRNATIAGTVLMFPFGMGSAGAWRFIYQLFKHGTHPVAIVSQDLPDPSIVQGAIMANIPVVYAPDENVLQTISNGERIEVDGTAGLIRVLGR